MFTFCSSGDDSRPPCPSARPAYPGPPGPNTHTDPEPDPDPDPDPDHPDPDYYPD